jgi:hypothetical protein
MAQDIPPFIQQLALQLQNMAAQAAAPPVPAPAPAQQRGRTKLREYASADANEWLIWKVHFGHVAENNQWNDAQQQREAAAALNGVAAQLVQDIDAGADDMTKEDLFELWEERFLPATAGKEARSVFTKATQHEGESVLMWHTRLRSMFHRAHPQMDNAEREASAELMDKFASGLANPQVRFILEGSDPVSFADALATAQRFAQAAQNTGGLQFNGNSKGIRKLNAMDLPQEDKRRCWQCGKPGHIQANCTNKPANEVAMQGNAGRGRFGRSNRGGRGRGQGKRYNNRAVHAISGEEGNDLTINPTPAEN